jgi:hydrogenase-4 component E
MTPDKVAWIHELILLVAGFFLLCSFGLIAAAQVMGCLRIYVIQSLLLATSAVLLGIDHHSTDLWIVAAIAIVAKVLLIPFLLRRTARHDMIARRELQQVINVPMSLLIALALTVLAYYIVDPMMVGTSRSVHANLPIGFAAVLIAIYTITVRREALPQMLSLLAIENGAFFAGIAIAPNFPLIGELAASFDVLIVVLTLGVLSTQIHRLSGSTEVGVLSELMED